MHRTGANRGIGCMAVLPAAIIGFGGLADGIGPTGWRGFAELFGWFIACLVLATLLAALLGRAGRMGIPAYPLSLVAVTVLGVLAYELLNWLGLDAPMSVKMLFTSSMQVIGAFGTGICIFVTANMIWRAGRR